MIAIRCSGDNFARIIIFCLVSLLFCACGSSSRNSGPKRYFYVSANQSSPMAADTEAEILAICPGEVEKQELTPENMMIVLAKVGRVVRLTRTKKADRTSGYRGEYNLPGDKADLFRIEKCKQCVNYITKRMREFDPPKHVDQKTRYLQLLDELDLCINLFHMGIQMDDRTSMDDISTTDVANNGFFAACSTCHNYFR